jgi:hypothetical protein
MYRYLSFVYVSLSYIIMRVTCNIANLIFEYQVSYVFCYCNSKPKPSHTTHTSPRTSKAHGGAGREGPDGGWGMERYSLERRD